MIIKSLVECYERLLVQKKVPAFGLTQEKIGYCVLLDRDGKMQDVISLSDPSDKKSKWAMLTVPASFKRSGIAPPLRGHLWGRTLHRPVQTHRAAIAAAFVAR